MAVKAFTGRTTPLVDDLGDGTHIEISALTSATPLAVTQSSTARTPALTRITVLTAAGSVAAGARRVSFCNAGAVDVTVLGATLAVGDPSVTFEAPNNDTLGALSYVTPAGCVLLIAEVR
jgi:hypothetical protein